MKTQEKVDAIYKIMRANSKIAEKKRRFAEWLEREEDSIDALENDLFSVLNTKERYHAKHVINAAQCCDKCRNTINRDDDREGFQKLMEMYDEDIEERLRKFVTAS